MLTEYSNKKCKKMEKCQKSYNYPCAENLINLKLNEDCLAEIFKYIPAFERPKVALVCKKWKRALHYSWGGVKKLICSYWRSDEYQTILQDDFKYLEGFNFWKSMLYKCGRYLTELDISVNPNGCIVKIINETCPFLVKLRLRIRGLVRSLHSDNPFSSMSKLKVLKIIFQSPEFTQLCALFINSFKNFADTLKELSLSNWYLSELYELPTLFVAEISQLKALQKLELFGIMTNRILRDYLKDTTLEFYHQDKIYHEVEIPLNCQTTRNIKELKLNFHEITDDFLYNIANNMIQLTNLAVRCTSVTDAGIEAITKMNNLKRLWLMCKNNTHITDSSIELLKNLKRLALIGNNKISDDSIMRILENSPDLKFLSIFDIAGLTSEFIKKAAELSRIREQFLELRVTQKDAIKISGLHKSPYIKIIYGKEREIAEKNQV